MIPGRTFTPEDVVAIFRRRIWYLVMPCALFAAGAAILGQTLPDRYRSDSVVLVVPQQVAQALVRTAVTTNLNTRLQSISQQILSRTRLERLMEEFNLYPAERAAGFMEDTITQLRKEIRLSVVKGDAFRVSYEGPDPKTAQQVAARVTSMFIEESLRDRAILAEGTDQFLEVQLDDARRRLVEQEKKLEEYRVRNSGTLPTQLGGNLQALQNTQMQIQATLDTLNRDRDQQLLLQRQFLDLENEAEDPTAQPAPTPAANDEAPKGSTAQQLAIARSQLAALEQRYKPDYPDIPRMRRVIEDLEKQLDAETLMRPVGSGVDPSTLSPREQARLKKVGDVQAQLRELDKRILASQTTETRLRTLAADYQRKIDVVPARESELTELTRDYGTLQDSYKNLLKKKEESAISTNLERRQIGEQFKLLEPAQLPEKPSSPNLPLLIAIGSGIGLAIGFAIIVLLEYRDTSFATDDEIVNLLQVPVLAVVPSMESEMEHRKDLARRVFLGVGMGSTVLACIAIIVYSVVR
jgi:polysaccharide chain length determinant protein (PEP-CTERM system associated)